MICGPFPRLSRPSDNWFSLLSSSGSVPFPVVRGWYKVWCVCIACGFSFFFFLGSVVRFGDEDIAGMLYVLFVGYLGRAFRRGGGGGSAAGVSNTVPPIILKIW